MSFLNSTQGRPSILIVDDDPTIRLIARASLEQSGFNVKEAVDGEQALQMFADFLPDLVLLDVLMPGMDGFATCAAIRSLPVGEDIPILVITGLEDLTSIKRAYEVGATDFITKPLNWTILHQRILYMLRANKAFKDLRQSERRLAYAQKIAKFGYWEYDFATKTCFLSPETCLLFGFSPDQHLMTPEDWDTLLPAAAKDELERFFNNLLPDNRYASVDIKIIPAADEERHLHLQGEVVRDGKGHYLRASGTVQDITERQRIESELLKIDKLESLRILAGGIAHDFNNILTTIMGNISLAKLQEKLDEEIYYYLDNAERAAVRARDLAYQLLTFSTAGKPIKAPTNLVKVIREAVQFACVGSPVSYELDIESELWPVEVDQGQISQVIHNLVINALQAMPEGGKIKVLARNRNVRASERLPLQPGNYVQVTVIDHGIGMPAEILGKIFDPFFSTKKQGCGLGLATSYAIVKNHGGHILVKSKPREGSQFEVYLPATTKVAEIGMDLTLPPVFGKGRILVMDDEDEVREVLRRILEYLGYAVDCARNGEEAIQICRNSMQRNGSFDLAILDLTVPGGMGGKETMQHLKALDPNIKGIIISGYAEDAILINYRDYGFCNFIRKPFRLNTLSRIVHKTLQSES